MPNDSPQITTPAAGVRTGLQTGVSVTGFLGLLMYFNIIELDAEGVLLLTPWLAAAGTILWRVVENKFGKALMREVPS